MSAQLPYCFLNYHGPIYNEDLCYAQNLKFYLTTCILTLVWLIPHSMWCSKKVSNKTKEVVNSTISSNAGEKLRFKTFNSIKISAIGNILHILLAAYLPTLLLVLLWGANNSIFCSFWNFEFHRVKDEVIREKESSMICRSKLRAYVDASFCFKKVVLIIFRGALVINVCITWNCIC